jgi:hypothetical protein
VPHGDYLWDSFASKKRKIDLFTPPARHTRRFDARRTHAPHPPDPWRDLEWTRAVVGAATARVRSYNPLPLFDFVKWTFASGELSNGSRPLGRRLGVTHRI